jgi:hypothetical protein
MNAAQPFTTVYRERVSSQIMEWASTDERVVASAVVGSMATGPGDRWSDLDLSFGVASNTSLSQVLEDWTAKLEAAFSAKQLFDLPAGSSIYRVFLLPGCLQVDLSFTPAQDFGALGPQFKLLFGEAVEKPPFPVPRAKDLIGYALHHLVRARLSIERGRLLQAEYWITSARNYALSLACLVHGLPATHGRGFDRLPREIQDQVPATLTRSLDRDSLITALSATVALLLGQRTTVSDLFVGLEPHLDTLTATWTEGDRE